MNSGTARIKIGKSKLAKFGLYRASPEGSDYLVTTRTKDGKPLMKYSEAQERLNDFEDRAKMLIRSI